jgi:hypothetical protein
MADFRGNKAYPIPHWGSLVDWDDPTALSLGLAQKAQNVRYLPESVATRYGIRSTILDPGKKITSLAELRFIGAAASNIPLLVNGDGELKRENPAGSGVLEAVTSPDVEIPAESYVQNAPAYNKLYLAIGDLIRGTKPPAIYDGKTGTLSRMGGKVVADSWKPQTAYIVGEVVTPTTPNAHLYRCTQAGVTSDLEPAWTTGIGDVIADAGAQWTETTPSYEEPVEVGHICSGKRGCIVLFFDEYDSPLGIADAGVILLTIANSGHKLRLNHIPTGPSPKTTKRVIAFTLSAGSAEVDVANAPFFWIPKDASYGGVDIKNTVIEDNVATTADFEFTDEALENSLNADQYFDRIEVPPAADIYFIPSLRRVVFTGVQGFESGHLLSDIDDPEGVRLPDSVVQTAENDGSRTIAWREMRNGEQLSLKENAGYAVSPLEGQPPALWPATIRWTGKGPCGPRAMDVGDDFLVFGHRTGVYRYDGTDCILVSPEIKETWARINWDYAHRIWFLVDENEKEIHIGVPLDGATEPNKKLTLNYYNGWSEPAVQNVYGQLVISRNARRWSIDDIDANHAMISRRELAVPVHDRINTRQVLFARNGSVDMIVPDRYDDNDDGIDSVYIPAFAKEKTGAILRFGGVSGQARGNGLLNITPMTDDPAEEWAVREFPLDDTNDHFAEMFMGNDEHFTVRFDNGAEPGSWFELHDAVLWAKPILSARI